MIKNDEEYRKALKFEKDLSESIEILSQEDLENFLGARKSLVTMATRMREVILAEIKMYESRDSDLQQKLEVLLMSNNRYLCVFCNELDENEIKSYPFTSLDRVKERLIFVNPSMYPIREHREIIKDREKEIFYLMLGSSGFAALGFSFPFLSLYRPEIGHLPVSLSEEVESCSTVGEAVAAIDLFFSKE